MNDVIIRTDGGAFKNPGPAASAFVVEKNKRTICIHSEYIGVATNNEAEYKAVIMALKYVKEKFVTKEISIFSDSQLVVKQLNGEYKVKAAGIIPLWSRAKELMSEINVSINWVPRAENKLADSLVEMVRGKESG